MKHLVIRADSTYAIGAGHLMRGLALAQAWRANVGGHVTIVSHCDQSEIRERFIAIGAEFKSVEHIHPHPSDLSQMLETLSRIRRPITVVDGYHFDPVYQRAVRRAAHKSLIIDDMAHWPEYCTDVLLNQNVSASGLDYTVGPDTQLLLGPEYALLRQEFLERHDRIRKTPEDLVHVLVTMGGTDPRRVSSMVVGALRNLDSPDVSATVVVSADNPDLDSIQKIVGEHPDRMKLVSGVKDMPGLLAGVDMAISGSGTTCLELAFMGIPALLLILEDNQVNNAKAMEEAGVAINMGRYGRLSEEDIKRELLSLILDKGRRKEMSSRGRSLIDGRGSERVARILDSDFNENPKSLDVVPRTDHRIPELQLRYAKYEDWQILLEWRNDPVTIANSIQSGPVDFDEHKAWFELKLGDPNCIMYMAEIDGRPIGQIRYDVDNGIAEVSVVVAPEVRGRGLGALLIQRGCEEAGLARYVAHVLPENGASLKAFMKSGFSPAGIDIIDGVTLERLESVVERISPSS